MDLTAPNWCCGNGHIQDLHLYDFSYTFSHLVLVLACIVCKVPCTTCGAPPQDIIQTYGHQIFHCRISPVLFSAREEWASTSALSLLSCRLTVTGYPTRDRISAACSRSEKHGLVLYRDHKPAVLCTIYRACGIGLPPPHRVDVGCRRICHR